MAQLRGRAHWACLARPLSSAADDRGQAWAATFGRGHTLRHRRAQPPRDGSAWAGRSILGTILTAPDDGRLTVPPPQLPFLPGKDTWVPICPFLHLGLPSPVSSCWSQWSSSHETPHGGDDIWASGWSGLVQCDWNRYYGVLGDWQASQVTERVYDSVDNLGAALRASWRSLGLVQLKLGLPLLSLGQSSLFSHFRTSGISQACSTLARLTASSVLDWPRRLAPRLRASLAPRRSL